MVGVTLAYLIAAPTGVAAQEVIGRLPESAVLRSLHDGQRIGPFGGWLTTGRDPVGVSLHSAPIVGIRYDVHVTNPLYYTMRVFGVSSTHDVYVPSAPSNNNRAGTMSSNVVGFESGFELALTGERSWHGFQPLINVGIGVLGGTRNEFDAGGYQPGVSVLYTYGLAARFPTGRNGELRADLGWLVHQVRYPNAFRTTPIGDDVPLRPTGTMTPLATSRAITVGWTWGIFR